MSGHRLSDRQRQVLVALDRHGALSAETLAQLLGESQPTAVHVANNLVRKGLAAKRRYQVRFHGGNIGGLVTYWSITHAGEELADLP